MSYLTLAGMVVALISAIYCIMTLFKVRRVVRLEYKRPFYIVVAIGVILWAVAEVLTELLGLFDLATFPSLADIFHIGGTLAIIIGLLYFWIKTSAPTKFVLKDWMKLLVGTGTVTGYLVYLFVAIVPSQGDPATMLESILNFFYPISAAVVFLLSYVIHTHYREGLIRRAYVYIADGIFFVFLGDMLFSYANWSGNYGIAGTSSDLLAIVGYGLLAVSFYIFHKKA